MGVSCRCGFAAGLGRLQCFLAVDQGSDLLLGTICAVAQHDLVVDCRPDPLHQLADKSVTRQIRSSLEVRKQRVEAIRFVSNLHQLIGDFVP